MNQKFSQIGVIIERLLREYGLSKQVKEAQAIYIWKEIVGEKISRYTEPVKVANGKLIVRVSSPSWRNELILLKPRIIAKLNQKFKENVIQDIVFT